MSIRTRKISSLIIFIFCFSVVIIFIILTSTAGVESIDEMVEIESSIETIIKKNTRNSVSYDVKLKEYSNTFKIKADYENIFHFIALSHYSVDSDKLYFAIDKDQLSKLNKEKTINILGIRGKNTVFLDKQKTLMKDRNTRKYLAPIGGTFLILLSIGVYIYRRFYYRFDI